VLLQILILYTNSVPTDAALMLTDNLLHHGLKSEEEMEALIEQTINLVVPWKEIS